MKQESEYRAWVYVRESNVPTGVVIAQMSRLLQEAERLGLSVVGMSQDIHNGRTLDWPGLKDALRAIRTGYADAVLVRNVSRLSEDRYTLLRIMEILQDHGAMLICTAEDAYAGLRLADVSQQLYQRATCFGLGMPWIEKEEATV